MAEHTRLAAAGLFLALTLAAVPALLPVDLARADSGLRAEAAAPIPTAARIPALVHLHGGELAPRPTVLDPSASSESVLHIAMSQAAPRDHTVAPGETLWGISQDAGIGVEALATANHLTLGALLHPGQVLVVPPVDPGSTRSALQTHEVAPGETLWGISRVAGVRVETLAAANHLPLDALLHPGQTLVVPSQDISASAAAGVQRSSGRGSAAAQAGVGAPVAPPYQALVGDFGPLAQPSEGMITSRFGWRIHPIFGTREFHTGLDIANRLGTPIRAAEGGIVRFVGWMSGYGRLVIVAHGNGLETSYSHLSAMLVSLGQRVVRGQVLGRMGSTGWSTGPHLLFEVRRNGVALDPVPYLQGTRGAATAVSTTEAAPAVPASAPSAAQDAQTTAAQDTQATAAQGAQATASQSEEHRTINGVLRP